MRIWAVVGDTLRMPRRESDTQTGSARTLSIVWLVTPIAIGAGLTALAAIGHYHWRWSDFVTGTLVNFGSSVALVSLFFLLERQFERRAERQWSLWSALASRNRRSEERTHALLAPLFVSISRIARLPIERLSCSAYRVDPRLVVNAQLEQVARVSLGILDSLPIRWTKGKGALGQCWITGQVQYMDLRQWNQRVYNMSRDQWNQSMRAFRMGLTYEEMKQFAGRYAAVIAVPVVDRNERVVGCLSVEVSAETGDEDIDFLSAGPVIDATASTAHALGVVWS
jgi:hypothetical protein